MALSTTSMPAAAIEPVGTRDASIVAAGAAIPGPLVVDSGGGGPLDLIVGRSLLPKIGSLRLSLWAVGGPLVAQLIRDQPLTVETSVESKGITRLRFQLPKFEARPGATLRLVVEGAEGRDVFVDGWLLVSQPFDPTDLRRWAEEHPVSVDPALPGVALAFREWAIPVKELGDAPLAIMNGDSKVPSSVTTALMIRQAKDGRVRIVVRPIPGGGQVDASLPSLVAFTSDPSARRDLFEALREAAAFVCDIHDFPNL